MMVMSPCAKMETSATGRTCLTSRGERSVAHNFADISFSMSVNVRYFPFVELDALVVLVVMCFGPVPSLDQV